MSLHLQPQTLKIIIINVISNLFNVDKKQNFYYEIICRFVAIPIIINYQIIIK